MRLGKLLAGLGVLCITVLLLLKVRERPLAEIPKAPEKDRPREEIVARRASPVTKEPFAGFSKWTDTYLAANIDARANLEAQGIELAIARRTAMAVLIQDDPERALELALPESLRKQLPASVANLMEERISAFGDYSVLAAIPLPGEKLNVPPVQRSLSVNGREFQAFVYGHREDAPSKRSLPIHGVAVDNRIALHTSAVQLLEPEEAAVLTPSSEQFCGVANTALGSESVPVKVGSDIVWLCHDRHIEVLREKLQKEAHQLAAAGGAGSVDGDTEESPYTEGRKRVIMFRVAFANLPTPDITSNQLVTVHAAVDTYWRINSYGRTSLAELGRGSEIVQVTLANNYEFYDDQAGPFRTDVRAAATAQGIDLSRFDFDIVYSGGGRPSFGFGGLGFVGGPGSWVVGASRGISCHELGHNLGFPHANFWDTSGQSAIGPGGNQEYGDPFDVMGGGGVDDGTGPGHYLSKFKWRIGWMSDLDFPRLTASTTVRIYAHDNPDSRGIRGVRFRRDNALDYFLEYRQRYTGNPWMVNGIGLRWGSVNGSSSQLIDTTPGTIDGKNDSPILIGRTFSDASAPVYITPLGLANTYPPSIDVRVNIGPFPGNQAPTMALGASTTSSSIGGAIVFAANAGDANGDPLAYAWEFGDATFSTNNSAIVTNIWRSAGEYVVRCVVSDMKGGATSQSLVVRIGAPTTFSISGRVLYKGQPVPDVLVRASSTRYAYSDSDGTYRITRLAAGNYNVTALLYPYTFVNPFFSNPVALGPNAANIDFIAVDAPQNDVTVVATGSPWRFWDRGTDLGTAWRTPEFIDTGWSTGPAELGYGEGDEATTISYGTDPQNKYITYYFRRSFNLADPAALTNYTVRFLRDDGGIVYLNGVEVLRDNMPAGEPTYITPAAGNSEEETSVALINSSLLVPGTNVFAVEVHQSTPDSSDVSFDLSFIATTATNFVGINAFYISQPANNRVFTSPATVDIVGSGYTMGDSYSLVEFFGDGTKLGEDAEAPFTHSWTDPTAGVHRLTAVATLAGGAKLTSAPVNITVTAPALTQTLITSNAAWRYNDENVDLGTGWRAPEYSDLNWSNGLAQIGFGDPGLATIVRAGSPRTPAYYFRHKFLVEDAGLLTNLTANLYRDDGAVIYLNGVEAARVLMPAGPSAFTNLATAAVDGSDETTPVVLSLPVSLLQDGPNVIAVELHQNSLTSSDLRFGLELVAHASGLPVPGVRITSPGSTNISFPNTLPITATAVGQEIIGVEFFRNEASLGQDNSVPYRIDWNQPEVGTWTLTAVAHESGGGAYTSAPVVITINAPPTARQLVGTRALWRYLDSGLDPGTTWTLRGFNDSAWSQGYARLGYGNDGESTVVSFGPDAAKRYITTYFRHAFPLTNRAGINALRLFISRDDGAVVYLNGTEVFRNNLRAGTVSYNSLALSTINSPDETNFISVLIATNSLVVATNVISVEVHQDSLQSTDLGIDLALIAESNTNATEGVYLTRPAEGARITLPAAVEMVAFAHHGSDPVTMVEFYANDTKVGEDTTFPYEASWTGASVGSHTLTAVGRLASANQVTSPPVRIVVQGPPIMISQVINTAIPFNSQWKYWNNPSPPPADWTAINYSDAAWSEGQARLGFGLDGERTTLPSGRAAYYFRRAFNVANPALVEDLIFQLQRDDGAVVYINGLEVLRSNMPPGAVTGTTLASATADGLDEQQAFISTIAASGLLPGTNIVAVEVHQSAVNSSDVGFDLHLTTSGDTSPRVVLTRPGNGAAIVLPADIDLEASAWAGQGRAVDKVEFFANGALLGEDEAAPYILHWPSVPQGRHTLMARSTDTFGEVVQSRTITINVGHEVVRTNFIAAGAVWKYLDNGSNAGTNFAQFNYNDATWGSGPAQLGYGDNDEATVVNGGPSGARFATTYFRRFFQMPADWTMTNLSFRLMRDDGAVVWLNGRELYRSNMPGGTILFNTFAAGTVDAANESTYFESSFTFTNLPPTNLVAVEIHQVNATSSDVSFDLEVVGTGYVIPVARPTLAIVRLADGSVQMSWPASATGWQLFYTGYLGTTWSQSSHTITTSNNLNIVTFAPGTTAEFYQLRRP